MPDGNAQYLRFLAGQIDVYSPRPEEVVDLKDKQKQLGITLKEIGIDTGSLFFAFNRNPGHYIHNGVTDPKYRWFTDVRFMRAIAHAVDKQGMINLCFHGLGVPAVSDTSPANKVFYNPNLKDYDYNLKEAGDLLDQAGYRLIERRALRPAGPSAGIQPRDQHRRERARPDVRHLAAGPRDASASRSITARWSSPRWSTKLDSTYDWDVVLIGFTGGIEPNNGADFLRSSGACTCGIRRSPSRLRRGRPRSTTCSNRARW